MSGKPDKAKLMIDGHKDETIYRYKGEINGSMMKIRNLENCTVIVYDWTKGMFIDNLKNCKVFLGPSNGSVFIRTSYDCEFHLLTTQLRFRQCDRIQLFSYSTSDPVVEDCTEHVFAPYNVKYEGLAEMFVAAGFEERSNKFKNIYDFTDSKELSSYHWKLKEEGDIEVIDLSNGKGEFPFEDYTSYTASLGYNLVEEEQLEQLDADHGDFFNNEQPTDDAISKIINEDSRVLKKTSNVKDKEETPIVYDISSSRTEAVNDDARVLKKVDNIRDEVVFSNDEEPVVEEDSRELRKVDNITDEVVFINEEEPVIEEDIRVLKKVVNVKEDNVFEESFADFSRENKTDINKEESTVKDLDIDWNNNAGIIEGVEGNDVHNSKMQELFRNLAEKQRREIDDKEKRRREAYDWREVFKRSEIKQETKGREREEKERK